MSEPPTNEYLEPFEHLDEDHYHYENEPGTIVADVDEMDELTEDGEFSPHAFFADADIDAIDFELQVDEDDDLDEPPSDPDGEPVDEDVID